MPTPLTRAERPAMRLTALGMLRENTPVQDYTAEWGLWVKREDLSCPPPGPPFSKTRGVYAHVAKRPEAVIGVLDTFHSQAGHAVARACQVLGKACLNFYPLYKAEGTAGHHALREPQVRSMTLGAQVVPLPAGRSCILYHQARRLTMDLGGYMMPNALKLEESVAETAREVPSAPAFDLVIVPASSGTIAAGVIRGFAALVKAGRLRSLPRFVVHMGYSRPASAVMSYLRGASGVASLVAEVIDEGYSYRDTARDGPTPSWPCNEYYDLKAFRWWVSAGRGVVASRSARVLFWNVG